MRHFTDLPTLGVGLAADVASELPNFRAFLGEGPDTIDYLNFGAHHVQKARIQYYIGDLVDAGFPLVFHPVNFNVALEVHEDRAVLDAVKEIAEYTGAVWAGQDIAVWTYDHQYLGSFLIPAILDAQSVAAVAKKVRLLNQELPCPFLVENQPVTCPLGDWHMLDFVAAISEQADCGIVLDVGHLIGYQQAIGKSLADMPTRSFPFDRVIEVHLAGLQVSRVGSQTNIIDQHASPIAESCWELLTEYIGRMTNLKGLTLEQEFCPDDQVRIHLRRARQVVKEWGGFAIENRV